MAALARASRIRKSSIPLIEPALTQTRKPRIVVRCRPIRSPSRPTSVTNEAIHSICDVQEKFRNGIYEFPKLYHPLSRPIHLTLSPTELTTTTYTTHSVSTTSKMLRAANSLQIPVYVTTQSRAKLGNTASELQPHLQGAHIRADIDKTLFSMITPEVEALLPPAGQGKEQGQQGLDAIIVGIETHICVTQTTLDLLARGHRVYILADGVSSINPEERGIALARLRDAGAVVTSSESVLFEILGDAAHEQFRAVSGLVKETKEETKGALGVFSKI